MHNNYAIFLFVILPSEAYEKLHAILQKTTLTKPITMASSVEQTSCLEGYYSVENQFSPKIIAFSYLGILSRYLDVPVFCVVIAYLTFRKNIITSDCVAYFLLFPIHRTILAALHFQSNLKRAAKLMIIGEPVLHVTYPKFKEGKATEKGPKVSSDYGIYQYQPYYLSQKLVSTQNALSI